MKAHRLLAAWTIALGLADAALGQAPTYGQAPPAAATAAGAAPAQAGPYGTPTPVSSDNPQALGTSRWIGHTGYLCDDDGVSPPIGSEVYLFSGVSIPFGGQYHGSALQPGFVIGGGLRTSFFNQAMDRAWVVDGSISHFNNRGNDEKRFPLKVIDFTGNKLPDGSDEIKLVQYGTPIRPGLLIRDTDRTFVSLGIGRDFYITAPADAPGSKCRWGLDAGGRYGTSSQEYDIIKHRTDVIGGFYCGVHYDYETPCRWGIFVVGGRWEYSYTWSDILQHVSDIQETNLMLTLGLRY
jgi:hypothetical protein